MVPTDSAAFERLRKEAKRFLKDLRREDNAAIRRYAQCWPPTAATNEARTLARAQLVIAREHGYRSWTHLKTSLLGEKGAGKMEQETSVFIKEFLAMLEAGRPIYSSLMELGEKQTSPQLRATVEEVAGRIKKGSSLAAAMAEHPAVFDPGYVGLIRIFESEVAALGGPRHNAPPA